MLNHYIWVFCLIYTSSIESSPAQQQRSISIMSYNVENLFDTHKNPEKEDHTYIPLNAKKSKQHRKICSRLKKYYWRRECLYLNWTQKALHKKVELVSKVISAYNNHQGPDIVVLPELENEAVLQLINQKMDGKYPYIVALNGNDRRGINIGLLSKFPYADKPTLITNKATQKRLKLREFLRVHLRVDKTQDLIIYGVHFPSANKSTKHRLTSLNRLTELANTEAKGTTIIAAGDFNINALENNYLYRSIASKDWHVSHIQQCDDCLGTYYYSKDKSWSFLDAVMVFKNAKSVFEKDSVRVWKPFKFQYVENKNIQKPKRLTMRGQTIEGVSDHFPVVARVFL